MTSCKMIAAIVSMVATFFSLNNSASAQQMLGFQRGVGAICNGPLRVAPCAVIQQWLAQQARWAPCPGQPDWMPQPQVLSELVVSHNPRMVPAGNGSLPGIGVLPRDGQIAVAIYQGCNGEPRCMAVAWGSIEISRCRNGVGAPGGCFGPSGELMKIITRALPTNLRPDVVLPNIESDMRDGPGKNNDGLGRNGWLRQRLGF